MNTKKIILGGKRGVGKVALVDDDMYDLLAVRSWQVNDNGYVVSGTRSGCGGIYRTKNFIMARLILSAPAGLQVDHINGNQLDNQRTNLRLCTNAQNCRNKPKPVTNTSGYKGVHWHRVNRKWTACIKSNGKQRYLGSFTDIDDAARAYNQAAQELFGEFAYLNRIGGGSPS